MTVGSPSSRSARLLSMACLAIVLCVLSLSPHADSTPKPTILWTQKLPQEVLAIVNADANRVTIQEPGEEEIGMANMSSDWRFGQAPFQVLGTPTGVLLLAVRDKSPFVQLIALDTTTGNRLWQIPCTSLPRSDLPKMPALAHNRLVSTFMAIRNQVVVVQQPDVGTSAGAAAKVLVSYDLRTGAVLWQSHASQIDYLGLVTQMNPELLNKGGFRGWATRRGMRETNKTAAPIANYLVLPQRGLLLKTAADQTGFTLDAIDLDTGVPAWTIHSTPVAVDYDRMMNTRAMQVLQDRAKANRWNAYRPLVSNSMGEGALRGEYVFLGCSGPQAEASQGTGQCSTLRAHSVRTGALAWEFQEHSDSVLGWIAAHEVVLVRLPRKIVALSLSTGERRYEISDGRVSALAGAFERRTYADGHSVYWFDQRGKDRKLVAWDVQDGHVQWEAPVSRDNVVGFIPLERAVLVATQREMIVLDKASGKETLRQRPEGVGSIRTVAAMDPRNIVVMGDDLVARYDTEPWKEVYRAVIPRPKRSVLGDMLLLALAAGLSSVPTPQLGPVPGTFVSVPYGMTPQGAANVYSLLNSQTTVSIRRLERQSASYSYFTSGDSIYRVNVTTGAIEKISPAPAKDAMMAMDESHGVGCLIRNHTITGMKMPMDERVRRTAAYTDALELGAWDVRRGAKLESSDPAKALVAYLSASRRLGDAVAAGEDALDKAVASLALGQSCARLSVLAPKDVEAWKAKAFEAFTAAKNLSCDGASNDLQDVCRAATQRLEGTPMS